eukprot:g1878.t1
MLRSVFVRRFRRERFSIRLFSSVDGNEKEKSSVSSLLKDKQLVKQVSILTGSQLVLNLGFAQMVPVIPLFAAQMGGHLGATGIGLVLSAPALANFLINIPAGRLVDTVGRKPLMIAGTLFTATGTAMTGLSSTLLAVIPFRFLVGAGNACSMTASSAYMADLSDRAPEHRGKIMGANHAVVGSMWVLGPAFGGFLAEAYGYENSFLIAGAGALLCSLGYSQLPETLDTRKIEQTPSQRQFSVSAWWKDVRPILTNPNQQGLIALACLFPLRFSCFSTAVALHASSVGNCGPKELGMMFTVLALCQGLGTPVGAMIADRVKGTKKKIIVPAYLLSTFAFAATAFSTDQSHFLISMAVQGCFNALAQPSIGAFTAEITPSRIRGQALSMQRQASSLIALCGPISLGLLVDATSCQTVILGTSISMAALSGVYAWRAQYDLDSETKTTTATTTTSKK